MTGDLHRLLRAFGPWVLLVPFLLLSMIPRGVMPGTSDGGGVTMVLCAGDGVMTVSIDPATMEPVKAPAPTDRRCAWAAAHVAVDLAQSQPVPLLVDGPPLAMHRPPLAPIVALSRATGLPPSTGPPLSA